MGAKDEIEEIEKVKKEFEMLKIEMILSPNFYKWLKERRQDYYKRGGDEISLSDFMMNWCYDMVTIQAQHEKTILMLKQQIQEFEGKEDTHIMYG